MKGPLHHIKSSNPRYSLSKAIGLIGLSVFFVLGFGVLVQWYLHGIADLKMRDDSYQIVAIVQTGPEKEALKTVYLEELLNLSVDRPTNLYRFAANQAEGKLLASPIIKEASIKKIKPGVLYIDYTAREPIAFLCDCTNTVVDDEGFPFPYQPFFTPKNLPEIYLGWYEGDEGITENVNQIRWGNSLDDKRMGLALELFHFFSKDCCLQDSHLKKIDVSYAFAPSYGQRQIVVTLEDHFESQYEGRSVLCIHPRILRLRADNYRESLKEYQVLRDYLLAQEKQKEFSFSSPVIHLPMMVVDLRVPNLAYVKDLQK